MNPQVILVIILVIAGWLLVTGEKHNERVSKEDGVRSHSAIGSEQNRHGESRHRSSLRRKPQSRVAGKEKGDNDNGGTIRTRRNALDTGGNGGGGDPVVVEPVSAAKPSGDIEKPT